MKTLFGVAFFLAAFIFAQTDDLNTKIQVREEATIVAETQPATLPDCGGGMCRLGKKH